ncbi:MAG: hypothetical protein GC171_04635 [Terrimonas sp.]|nr:hypothetical protein [Terrimonas sp.]
MKKILQAAVLSFMTISMVYAAAHSFRKRNETVLPNRGWAGVKMREGNNSVLQNPAWGSEQLSFHFISNQ